MADENLNDRLDRIETRLSETVTHDELVRELGSVAANIADLRTEVRTGLQAMRGEMAGLRGEMQVMRGDMQVMRSDNQVTLALLRSVVEALGRWPELFAGITDRLRRLEEDR